MNSKVAPSLVDENKRTEEDDDLKSWGMK